VSFPVERSVDANVIYVSGKMNFENLNSPVGFDTA